MNLKKSNVISILFLIIFNSFIYSMEPKKKNREIAQPKTLRFQALNQLAQFVNDNIIDENTICSKLISMPPEFLDMFNNLLAQKRGFYKNRNNALSITEAGAKEVETFKQTFWGKLKNICVGDYQMPCLKNVEDMLVSACFYAKLDIVNFLLKETRVDPNVLGSIYDPSDKALQSHKLTPLMAACLAGNQLIVEYLIQAGAITTLEDTLGLDAFEYTLFNKIEYLEYYCILNRCLIELHSNVRIYPIPSFFLNGHFFKQGIIYKLNKTDEQMISIINHLLKHTNTRPNFLTSAISSLNKKVIQEILDSKIISKDDIIFGVQYCTMLKNHLAIVSHYVLRQDLVKFIKNFLDNIKSILLYRLYSLKNTQ